MKNNRKAVEERQMNILNLVREKGEIRVDDIAERFGISTMTVRRDLQLLEEQRLLQRIYGGAISIDTARSRYGGDGEVGICRDRISEYAARFLDNGDTIFINGSRTALNMLHYVKNKKINVVTNNGWGIGEDYPGGVSVKYTGGETKNRIMVGEYVMRNLLDMKADKTFIGCSAVYDDGEFRYDIPTEIGINEAMITRTSKDLFVLADHTKIKHRADNINLYGSCTYERPTTLITDERADVHVIEQLRGCGIKVIVVKV